MNDLCVEQLLVPDSESRTPETRWPVVVRSAVARAVAASATLCRLLPVQAATRDPQLSPLSPSRDSGGVSLPTPRIRESPNTLNEKRRVAHHD